jgi:hypothetical protein
MRAKRAHVYIRLFFYGFSPSLQGNILRLTMFTHRAYADGFSSYFRWTYYKSQQVAWATYFSCSRTALTRVSVRVRVRAWLNIHLSINGFSSDVLGTYYKWPHVTWATYLSCSCSRTARTRESVCASARVIKRSLIFEQISRGYMGYLIYVWMHVLTVRTSIHSRIVTHMIIEHCQARDGQWLVLINLYIFNNCE